MTNARHTASTFESRLRDLINSESMESGSNTPDFILAMYMKDCLSAFENAVQLRDVWYGICRGTREKNLGKKPVSKEKKP